VIALAVTGFFAYKWLLGPAETASKYFFGMLFAGWFTLGFGF